MWKTCLLVLGLTTSLVRAHSEAECGLPFTVTVTVTPSTQAAENGLSATNSSSSSYGSSLASASASTAVFLEPITNLSSTSYLTRTKVIGTHGTTTALPAQSSVIQDGYYFALNNGTTIWLGSKTPTSGASLVTSTSVVIVQPQPQSTDVSSVVATSQSSLGVEEETSTSFVTLLSISFHTRYLTMELTPEPVTIPPSTRLPPHQGSYGWNATFPQAQEAASSVPASGLLNVHPTTEPVWPASDVAAYASSYATARHRPRQLGAVVSATINGVVVSWTNSYAGVPVTSDPMSSSQASSTTAALPFVPTPVDSSDSGAVTSTIGTLDSPASATPPSSLPQSVTQVLLTSSGNTMPTPEPNSSNSVTVPISTLPVGSVSLQLSTAQPTPSVFDATQSSSAAPAAATASCGSDDGLFTVNFDDLPHFSTESPLSDIPPIFNPYYKLFFNSGYGYVPPPSDPYGPISPPQLAVYNYHNETVSQTSVDDGLVLHGEIGAGPRSNESAYWVDAYSMWIGCANNGPGECAIEFIGYDQLNSQVAKQTAMQPPCPGLINCKLAQINLTGQFRQLAGLQILAYVDETPVTFYMDDLSLGWSNNTCAAQLERSSHE